MKKLYLIILSFCATISLSFAQEFEISPRGDISLGDRQLSESEVRLLLGDDVYDNTFIPAIKQKKVGMGLTISGGACAGLGACLASMGVIIWGLTDREYPLPANHNIYTAPPLIMSYVGLGTCVVGLTLLGVGVPSLITGQKRLRQFEEDTNNHLSQKVSLNLSASPGGFVLRLVF